MAGLNRALETFRGGVARASRKLATDVVASGIATIAVTLAVSKLKHQPTPPPAPAGPAAVRLGDEGKLLDRVSRHGTTAGDDDRAPLRRTADFVKLSGFLATVSRFPPAPASLASAAPPPKPAEPVVAEQAPERSVERPKAR